MCSTKSKVITYNIEPQQRRESFKQCSIARRDKQPSDEILAMLSKVWINDKCKNDMMINENPKSTSCTHTSDATRSKDIN